MPNLPGRYEHSIAKGEAIQSVAPLPYVAEYVDCLGGCGAQVGPGQRCAPCATRAVLAWLATRKAA